jgi:hypothetical protein
MRYNINESEVKRILEMHSKEKKDKFIIKEQSNTKDDLSEMITQGCVPGGKLVKMTFTSPKDYSIKLESTKNPGSFRYFFINGSVGQKPASGKFSMTNMTWDVAACRSKIAQKTNQVTNANSKVKLDDLKAREGWIEYDELELPENGMSKQGADNGKYGDPKIFDLGGGKSVKLYKKPGAQGVTDKGYTKEQTDTIQKYHDKGYKLADELTNDEKLSWEFEKISVPGLPADWGMYVDPKGIAQKADATDFEQFSNDQNIDLKTCKGKLDSYYDAFSQKKVFPVSTFNSMKKTVQACVNIWSVKGWGGLRPGHFRDMVDVMRGGKGGPSSYGPDSKWKLQ